MSLILVRVKRKDACHHQNGKVYKTGEPFEMEEEAFAGSLPGFFEKVEAKPKPEPEPEQIKTAELPPGDPPAGPATAAIQEPEQDQKTPAQTRSNKRKLDFKKQQ